MKLPFNLTPARLKWLRHLAAVGMAERRGRGRVGYDCMQLGWTDWVRVDRVTRQRLTMEEVFNRGYAGGVDLIGEELTAEGRRILEMAGQGE